MPPQRPDCAEKDDSLVEEALAAMNADDLRELFRHTLLELDGRARGRVLNRLLDGAARSSGWVPSRPMAEVVAAAVSFARAAVRAGRADAADVDLHLRHASSAFLAKDYSAAHAVFRTLLVPIANADIDLGQHETVDDVLGVCPTTCAVQYVVATYMTATTKQRAEAVRAAIGEVEGIGYFGEPVRELERAAVEPLPDQDEFLRHWRSLLEDAAAAHSSPGHGSDRRWLREAVRRLEGADGLARIARASRSSEDLRAWCEHLVEQRDWANALEACEEAASLAGTDGHARGAFLDGAALAAQELVREDLPSRLERTWREVPTLVRLMRWIASTPSPELMRERAAQALPACSPTACRQRALLHLLVGDYASAAELLAAAPGLGWSSDDHPGGLVFPVFHALLSGNALNSSRRLLDESDGLDRLVLETSPDGPCLTTPDLDALLALVGVSGPITGNVRATMLGAMRAAAEKRVAGVTEEKRRRHYDHAARLVAACAQLDCSRETSAWVSRVQAQYRRFPALRAALDMRLGPR